MPLYNPVSTGSQLSSRLDILNMTLATSVAANALTIELKTQAAGSPAVSDPVKISFRSSTITSGIYNQRSVTSALSIVVPSGATLGHASGVQHDIWVYAIDNAGTVELAVSQALFPENQLVTTTTISGSATSNKVMYSTTGRSNVPVRLIGRLLSTQTTAGTYALNVSAIYIGDYGILTVGRVVGAFYTNTAGTTIPTTAGTAPFATKVYDYNNCFSSNTFTSTEDGLYCIQVNFATQSQAWAANSYFYVGLGINGTTITRSIGQVNIYTAVTTGVNLSGTVTIPLAANDTVVVRWLTNDTGHSLTTSAADNWISISKVIS